MFTRKNKFVSKRKVSQRGVSKKKAGVVTRLIPSLQREMISKAFSNLPPAVQNETIALRNRTFKKVMEESNTGKSIKKNIYSMLHSTLPKKQIKLNPAFYVFNTEMKR